MDQSQRKLRDLQSCQGKRSSASAEALVQTLAQK